MLPFSLSLFENQKPRKPDSQLQKAREREKKKAREGE